MGYIRGIYNNLRSGGSNQTNSSDIENWVFDIQYFTYPLLEGKLKLYITCNPEFPEFDSYFGCKPSNVLVQVAPSNQGYEVYDESFGDYIWRWDDAVSFDVNEELSQHAMYSGEPSEWIFDSNSNIEYAIKIVWTDSPDYSGNRMTLHRFFTMPTLLQTPTSVSYSNGEVETKATDRNALSTAIEFKNTLSAPYPWNTYSDSVRNLFFEASCQNTEASLESKYDNEKMFKIWSKETHTIGVNFMSGVPSGMRSTFKDYVKQTVDIINDTIGISGFRLELVDGITNGNYSDIDSMNGAGEIQLWWGAYEELWNMSAPSDYRLFGEWSNDEYSENTYLTSGWIKLCTEKVWTMNFQGIVWEEIVECLGVGNDVVDKTYSAFSDYWFPAKSLSEYNGILSPYEDDLDVLRMAYNHDLPSNIEPWECANIIFAQNGCLGVGYGYESIVALSVGGLNAGDTYSFRSISVSGNDSSKFTTWVKFSMPGGYKPAYWSWSAPPYNTYVDKDGNTGCKLSSNAYIPMTETGIHPITAKEWNEFISRVNEVREYMGRDPYTLNNVSGASTNEPNSPSDVKTAYNLVVDAIQSIGTLSNGDPEYGAYLYKIENGRQLNAKMFLDLADELNAVIDAR